MSVKASILFIDAYDSFSENIAALLQQQLDVEVTLRPNCAGVHGYEYFRPELTNYDAIVLGPGPGNPTNADDVGAFNQIWEWAAEQNVPVLGICLGFQSLCARHCLWVDRLDIPCHGHTKKIYHMDTDIFRSTGRVAATNYNSLGVRVKLLGQSQDSSLPSSPGSMTTSSSATSFQSIISPYPEPPDTENGGYHADDLDLLAWDREGWVMAVKHKIHPFYGFQFHPESCKSNAACLQLLKNWWRVVQSHNQHFRQRTSPVLSPGSPMSEASTLPDTNSDGDEMNRLSTKLVALTETSYSGYICAQANGLLDSQAIAELCYNMSSSNSTVMLESTKKGRYSIFAFPNEAAWQIQYTACKPKYDLDDPKLVHGQCKLVSGTSTIDIFEMGRHSMMEAVEDFVNKRILPDNASDLPFKGGFMGYISYEFGTGVMDLKLSEQVISERPAPELSLLWVERSIVFDHETGIAYVQSIRYNDYAWINEMLTTLKDWNFSGLPRSDEELAQLAQIQSSTTISFPDHDSYISRISSCKAELMAGNSYELCLTTTATASTPHHRHAAWHLYNSLRRHNPVPFASFLRLDGTTILSSSPEQYLSWSADTHTLDMVPMKGTVKKTRAMTREKATEILSSAKESAENLMIADLIRHDLQSTVGRDAKVEVIKLCDVVETETVYQLVSHIRAHVPQPPSSPRSSKSSPSTAARQMTHYGLEALATTLPPGSMTGAPKKRSCEILHRLEARPRGIYSGVIGYIDVGGNGGWSVAIRTAFSQDEDNDQGRPQEIKWQIGAGGAITVLSDEEQEWEEMMTKLDSVLRAFRP